MAEKNRVIVIGGGHNGLVAAAYLAKAGRSVLLVERAEAVGGMLATEDFAPGFSASAIFPSEETFSSEIARELALEQHGLRWLPPGGILLPRLDAPAFYLPPCKGDGLGDLSALGANDTTTLVDLDALIRRLGEALANVWGKPLPDLEPSGLAGFLNLALPGLRLRRLGARDLAETMRLLPMPIADVVEERFESAELRAVLAAGGITGSWLGPRSPGSTLNLLLHRLGQRRGALAYPRRAAGGGGALASALAAAAKDAGAEIRCGVEVERVLVRGGKARGVILEGGEEIEAGAVLSCIDPKSTLLRLVDPTDLDADFLLAAKNIRARGTVGLVHLGISALPKFQGAPEDPAALRGRIQIGASVDLLEQAFDATKYGRLPSRPYLDVAIPTIDDPDLAPEGNHVLTAWVQFPPHTLRESTWDEQREALGDLVVGLLDEHAPGLAAGVEARRVLTPADIEARFGASGGCIYHVEPALDLQLYLRPLARWGQHRTPIGGLYLGSSGTHGGGPLSGLAGRNSAQAVLD